MSQQLPVEPYRLPAEHCAMIHCGYNYEVHCFVYAMICLHFIENILIIVDIESIFCAVEI